MAGEEERGEVVKRRDDAFAADVVLREWMRATEESVLKDDTTHALRGVIAYLSGVLQTTAPALAVSLSEIAHASCDHEHAVSLRNMREG